MFLILNFSKFYLLHFGDIANESIVIHEVAEALQLVKVPDEVLANPLVTSTTKGRMFEEEQKSAGILSFHCHFCDVCVSEEQR